MTDIYDDVTMPGIPPRFFDTIPESIQKAAMDGDERRRIIRNPRTGNWMLVVRVQEVEPWTIGLDEHVFTTYDPKADIPKGIDKDMLRKMLWSMDTFRLGGPEKALAAIEKGNEDAMKRMDEERWEKARGIMDDIDKTVTRSSRVMPKVVPEKRPELILPGGFER